MAIAHALGQMPRLTHVGLAHAALGASGAEALACILLQRRLPALEDLRLNGNALGAEGAATLERLQRALPWAPRRHVVHAGNNGFDAPTAAALRALGCIL